MNSNKLILMGSPQLVLASGEKLILPSRKSWGVIGFLATKPDQEIPREEIANLLWANSGEEHARASLRQELAATKKILARHDFDPIHATKDSLKISSDEISIDIAEFVAFSTKEDILSLKSASSLYGGEFLQGLSIRSEPFETWVSEERRHFEKIEIDILIKIIAAAKAGEQGISVVDAADKILSIDNSQENAYRELMLHYAGIGRRAEALRQYNLCKEALRHSLDTVPSVETKALADEIRSQENSTSGQDHEQLAAAKPSASRRHTDAPQNAATVSQTRSDQPTNAPHLSVPPQKNKSNRGKQWLGAALAIAVLPTAVMLVQYFSAGQKITRSNLLCSLPFVRNANTNPIPIDGILPFDESYGKRLQWGIRKFLQEHRSEYPFEVKVNIHDSKGDVEELSKILSGLEKSKPVAVLGPMQSRLAYDAKNWGNRVKIPIVSSLASASYLTSPGVRDYFFRVGMSDGIRGKALVDWMRLKNLHNNPYILHEWAPATPGLDEPEIYGASQASAVKRHLGRATTLRFKRGDKPSQLAAARKVKNDGRAIAIFGYTSNIKNIIADLQSRGITSDIFLMGVITTELEKANYPYPDKLHVVTGIISEASRLSTTDKLRQEFIDDNPDLEYDLSAYYAYDSTGMVLDAIKVALEDSCFGEITGDSVAQQLRQTPTKRRKLISGGFLADTQEVYFDSDGLKIINGKFEHVGIGN